MNNVLKQAIVLSIDTIKKNISRTVLTVTGVMLGIMMVVLVFAAGIGVRSLVLGQLSGFGDNWINIEVKIPSEGKASSDNARSLAQGVSITTLTYEDAEALERLGGVDDLYAAVTTQAIVSVGAEQKRPTIFAVTASYPEIDSGEVATGRFFSPEEERGAQSVAVLGSELAIDLFGNTDPVGRSIKVNKKNYLVLGVMEEQGVKGFLNMDEMLFLPLRTAQKKIMNIDHVLYIIAQVRTGASAELVAEEMRAILRERHDIDDPVQDDFAVTTLAESVELVGTILDALTWLLVGLAAISLLVGGVGIMNVMYVSVAERTFEIGLRKSVGASAQAIQLQFLVESVVVTCVGGVLGMILGICLAYLVSLVAQVAGYDWAFGVPWFALFLGFVFSCLVGIGFGWYPAKQASLLDPIQAMRKE